MSFSGVLLKGRKKTAHQTDVLELTGSGMLFLVLGGSHQGQLTKGSTAVRKFSGLNYCVEATGANVTVTVSQTLKISCKGWEAHHRALKPFLSLY